MKCPHCNVNLLMSERQGVEIDYCPECRGVWLDRGELDKIVERGQAELAGSGGGVAAAPAPPRDDRDRYRGDSDSDRDRYRADERRGYEEPAYNKKKKRKSFIEDIFEF